MTRVPGVVYVGDGLSDRAAAEAADRRFAKGKLAEHCRRHGIAFEQFETLADVHTCLPALVGGDWREETRP